MDHDPDDGRDGTEQAGRLDRLMAERREAATALRERGVEPWPTGVDVDHTLAQLREAFADRLEAGEESQTVAAVAGRLVARRGHGKLAFLVLVEDGTELQVLCQLDVLGDDGMGVVDDLAIGDWVAARGAVVRSKRGELSVKATTVRLIGRALRPLPDRWHGLRDVETRFRQREVDLVVNPDARRILGVRTRVVAALRAELADRDYLEVETPILHPVPGGALAKPFVTRMHALDLDLFLRIAPELYLKRLIAGGLRRVFEIGRVFRNEGLSTRHNPEFTMLESYEAYADYHDVMTLTQALVQRAAGEAVGTTSLHYDGRPLDLGGRWPRRSVLELVRAATGDPDLGYRTPTPQVRQLCTRHDVRVEDGWGVGKLVLELYEKLVEHTLWEPTFVIDYPVEVSPLAHRHRADPLVTERFELIVAGRELANAFSELTDPDEQRSRFEAQARARAGGDDEAMALDESYLRAMELGMPPTGGLGLGVDRLVMLLADVTSIREVILFPTLRPEALAEAASRPPSQGQEY